MNDKSIMLWCIHGNLQLPSVWDELLRNLRFQRTEDGGRRTEDRRQRTEDGSRMMEVRGRRTEVNIIKMKENLWLSEADSFSIWTTEFCAKLNHYSNEASHYLLGYSLAGRLALHAAIHFPELFKGIIIASADPGIKNDKDRLTRLVKDKKWGGTISFRTVGLVNAGLG